MHYKGSSILKKSKLHLSDKTFFVYYGLHLIQSYEIMLPPWAILELRCSKQKATHSMARDNLNKSKKVLKSITTASKCMPKRPRICINWNPPFQTQIYLVKVPLNVNIVKQDLLHKKQFLKILWSEVWKGGFQLIQILGL